MFEWLKKRSQKKTTLEEQLRVLSECGFARRVDASSLLESFDRDSFEDEPWLLTCIVLGSEIEGSDPPAYRTNALYGFDTECIEDRGDYARVVQRLADVAELPLRSIRDHVDVEEGTAWVEFELDGRTVRWGATLDDDWFDGTILARFARLLDEREMPRRLLLVETGDQSCLVGCATEAQRAMLAERTGLKTGSLA